MRLFLFIFLVLFILVAQTSAQNQADAVRQSIEDAWSRHVEAGKRGDAKTTAAIFADDAVYATLGQPEIRGRNSLDSTEAAVLAAITISENRHTTLALKVFGDLAIEIGSAHGRMTPKGQKEVIFDVPYSATWTKQPNGAWRISYMVVGH